VAEKEGPPEPDETQLAANDLIFSTAPVATRPTYMTTATSKNPMTTSKAIRRSDFVGGSVSRLTGPGEDMVPIGSGDPVQAASFIAMASTAQTDQSGWTIDS
jgi:hypothetical protein